VFASVVVMIVMIVIIIVVMIVVMIVVNVVVLLMIVVIIIEVVLLTLLAVRSSMVAARAMGLIIVLVSLVIPASPVASGVHAGHTSLEAFSRGGIPSGQTGKNALVSEQLAFHHAVNGYDRLVIASLNHDLADACQPGHAVAVLVFLAFHLRERIGILGLSPAAGLLGGIAISRAGALVIVGPFAIAWPVRCVVGGIIGLVEGVIGCLVRDVGGLVHAGLAGPALATGRLITLCPGSRGRQKHGQQEDGQESCVFHASSFRFSGVRGRPHRVTRRGECPPVRSIIDTIMPLDKEFRGDGIARWQPDGVIGFYSTPSARTMAAPRRPE
jgi:hypothetical protein